ncbi:MAG TPA: hypothetical protein VN419_13075 [Humidesulfovibrio sp.]|uniref:hypothetical protein n=1 Tax=Humidesulfovibrio sp. TaxID=2910988 RepID=UPI002B975FEF|nr:hypothetical protein [Humidesulfovibrio sp.]HWR04930.1 hypothetical protein [Humidesulfovibrio sp.]
MTWNTQQGGNGGKSGGVKPGAGGKPQGYDSHGRYTGPRGGAVSLSDGSVSIFGAEGRLYADAGKQAGADSEAGRREPKSLLTATSEQLERIAAGTGQAVTQGAAGAKQALSRTWEELATNEELHKGVEFGVNAAGEVSKDVGMQVGKHAATVYGGYKLAAPTGGPRWTNGLGPVPGLVWTGVNSYKTFPQKGQDLGDRIQTIHNSVYGEKK